MNDMTPIPGDFAHADEHPLLAVAYTLTLDGHTLMGERLSMTTMVTRAERDGPVTGTKGIARLRIDFPEFSLTLSPEVLVREVSADGTVKLTFVDPTGPHLPQLRYVLNSTIAGELASMDGLMTYSGPTVPKAAKAAQKLTWRDRLRTYGVMATCVGVILAAGTVLVNRWTTGTELHPVFVEAQGRQMKATIGGQLSFLNPEAKQGEVLFALTSNAGDILNFQMPCDCEVRLSANAYEGATLLPSDQILTILDINPEIRARTLMSIEGLARVMTGDRATLEMQDGRSIPVDVIADDTSNAAALRGDLFVPVDVRAPAGALTDADMGTAGRLRLSTPLLGGLLPEFGT
ncbi:hypothetical protein JANAI62_09120 [Jannaschia pagri]|uniref:Uncharacterized protein n=1 Tax=Jannaschia pagri TaxID=2829797 RepID=A0ABQ4NJC1_9RHOB|nr:MULTISPECIES: hypothetical protein [unclassified Jannaschia]GIT89603.1 hypothetical protein JANAI61_00610 [Jannaschia sp. AI_61]GIT94289.1 hypothetical protein JANAI62_09120 [Jannaschia sp. AI_62]